MCMFMLIYVGLIFVLWIMLVIMGDVFFVVLVYVMFVMFMSGIF